MAEGASGPGAGLRAAKSGPWRRPLRTPVRRAIITQLVLAYVVTYASGCWITESSLLIRPPLPPSAPGQRRSGYVHRRLWSALAGPAPSPRRSSPARLWAHLPAHRVSLLRLTGVRASALTWVAMIGLVDVAAASKTACLLLCDTSTTMPIAFISAMMADRPRLARPFSSPSLCPYPKRSSGSLASSRPEP